jgi:dipeptidyl aminopeptidase/acylaminoacyl peptidase
VKRPLVVVGVVATMFFAPIAVGTPAQAKVRGPNGQIVFVRTDFSTGSQAIYFVNPDGSHLRRLAFPYDMDAPHWSPNGDVIAFSSSLNGACPPCLGHTVILDSDTGDYRILPLPTTNFGAYCTVWSPNAKHFACAGENDADPSVNGVYTIRSSDGGNFTRLSNADPSGAVTDIPIDYSPNGTRIVFGRVSVEDHSCTRRSALYVVSATGHNLHRITPWGYCDDDGSWSPNGRWIAFEKEGSIYVVHPDGTGLRKVPLKTKGQAFAGDISWSPNGKEMSFILFAPTSDGTCCQEGIGTANANGTRVHFVTHAPDGLFDHEGDWGAHAPAT